ncbi:MAG: hypothetical protein V1816_14940 [Pseudomonadota bacterium]
MIPGLRDFFRKSRPPWLILGAGLLFSLFLLTLIREGVFFAGDMGLKLLQVKQFQADLFRFDLNLPAPEWARSLWNEGLYPFHPEFVYQLGGKHYIHYPFLFAWLSIPFYAGWGFWGLHVLPLLSVWVAWAVFFLVCRKMEYTREGTSLALWGLIFASPLTFYSALFWEHTPAVALAFGGMALILTGFRQKPSLPRAAAAGGLIGISAWLRPEMLCLAIGLTLLFPILKLFKLDLKNRWVTATTAFLPILLFFLTNYFLYGHPLGLQGQQVVEGRVVGQAAASGFSLIGQTVNAVLMAEDMGRLTLVYFPLAFSLPAIRLLRPRKNQSTPTGELDFLLILSALVFVGTAFILPLGAWNIKQWGPRYLLLPVCLLCLGLGPALDLLRETTAVRKKIGVALLATSLAWGAGVNTYFAASRLARDFSTRVKPTAELVTGAPEGVVAVSIQHIAQELAALIGPKIFFLAGDEQSLVKLGRALEENGQSSFIYIKHIDRPGFIPENRGAPLAFSLDRGVFAITFQNLGRSAKYERYRAEISPLGLSPAPPSRLRPAAPTGSF